MKLRGNFHFSQRPAPKSWWLAPKSSSSILSMSRGWSSGAASQPLDGVDELVAVVLEFDQEADVVKEAGEEGLVGEAELDVGGDHAAAGADGDGVRPEVLGGDGRGERAALEELGEAGGDGDVLDGVEPEKDDGAVDGPDLAGEAVEGGVDHLEDPRGEGGVFADDVVQVLGGAGGRLNQLDDLQRDFREGRDVRDLADC